MLPPALHLFHPTSQDLYVQALAAIQALPWSDPDSFFQQAAIHGFPFIPYRDAVNPADPFDAAKWNRSDPDARWGGYCESRRTPAPASACGRCRRRRRC